MLTLDFMLSPLVIAICFLVCVFGLNILKISIIAFLSFILKLSQSANN